MRLYTTAESVHIEQDERGFDLRVTTVDGDDFLFNIQDVARELVGSRGMQELLEWYERRVLLRALTDEFHSVRHDKWPGQ